MSSVWPIRTLRSAAGAMAEAKFVDASSAARADGYSPRTAPVSIDPISFATNDFREYGANVSLRATPGQVPHLSLGAGIAVRLLADSPPYNNIVYGRIALSF